MRQSIVFAVSVCLVLTSEVANAAVTYMTKNECFQVTPISGSTSYASYQSDFSTLQASSSFTQKMRVSKLKLCGTFLDFDGLQMFISDGAQTIALGKFGRESSCEEVVVPRGTWITKAELGYNSVGLNFFRATTNQNVKIERGQFRSTDKRYTEFFTEDEPLIGLVGYETSVLKALGFYRYKCATAIDPNEVV